MRISRGSAIALLLLTLASASHAGDPARTFAPPLILRLDGIIGKDREAAEQRGFTVASFGVLGNAPDVRVWLGVNGARTIGGDTAVDGKDVLEAMAGYQPNFLLAGSPAQVAQLTTLTPGTTVSMEGLVDRQARTFLVRVVTPRPPATE